MRRWAGGWAGARPWSLKGEVLAGACPSEAQWKSACGSPCGRDGECQHQLQWLCKAGLWPWWPRVEVPWPVAPGDRAGNCWGPRPLVAMWASAGPRSLLAHPLPCRECQGLHPLVAVGEVQNHHFLMLQPKPPGDHVGKCWGCSPRLLSREVRGSWDPLMAMQEMLCPASWWLKASVGPCSLAAMRGSVGCPLHTPGW